MNAYILVRRWSHICNTPGHADKFNPSQVWLKLAYCGSGEEDFKTILFQLSTLCKETGLSFEQN